MSSVLGLIRRSLSGESSQKQSSGADPVTTSTSTSASTSTSTSVTASPMGSDSNRAQTQDWNIKSPTSAGKGSRKKKKRHRSDEVNYNDQKKSRLVKSGHVASLSVEKDSEDEDDNFEDGNGLIGVNDGQGNRMGKVISLPEETPEWGSKLLAIIQGEFKSISLQMSRVERAGESNSATINSMSKRLDLVEKRNKLLLEENSVLKEKLLDMEFQQRRGNLIFDGLSDVVNETEVECLRKIRSALRSIPGLDAEF